MSYKSILIGLSVVILAATTPGKGHLKFDESFKDLGEIKHGPTMTCSFAFMNTGEKKVKINSVVTGSNALMVKPIHDSIIEPDANGEIILEFITVNHAKGDFAFGITVNSNADNKEVRLKLFGTLTE